MKYAHSILEIRDVTKIYGNGNTAFTALHKITLAIQEGESIAIVGKSGSGKSTLMHLMALLDKPTEGSILIHGQASEKLPTRKLDSLRNKEFGFVFQQFFLNANASVLENVILPLKIAGLSSKERNKRGLAALEAVELADKAKNRANDLSGGQKQRAVIARALINKPRIIFADEPTGNLDSITSQRIEDLLFGLNRSENITLIVVTHDKDLASRCDRQVYLKDGHIVPKLT